MKQSVVYIGVDVAKANLDVAWAAASRRFPNAPNGHAALLLWIKQSAAPVQLICEASGGYEQALLESLEQNNLAVTLVQAIRVRQYARAAGILAKTDTIDAKVLAAFGAAMPIRVDELQRKLAIARVPTRSAPSYLERGSTNHLDRSTEKSSACAIAPDLLEQNFGG
jgi:transposase